MPSDPCPTREELAAMSWGRLAVGLLERVAAHLDHCPRCLATVETLGPDDPLADDLTRPVADGFADEPGCHAAVARFEAVGAGSGEPTAPRRPATTESPALPERLGVYQILGPLGRGGMGAVYRAWHTLLKREVALKVLPPERTSHAPAVARFRREMEAVGRLNHDNIVRAVDAGEAAGVHYLVTELVPGDDLSRYVAGRGPLPVAETCALARGAALALEHAHQAGLVHRDVKPSNLMRTPDGRVKLLDLGLALLRDDLAAPAVPGLTDTGQIMGTADYIAPEQAFDTRTVDARADLYSLGCTVYFLLTGQPPFRPPHPSNPWQTLLSHAQAPPPPIRADRPDVPERLAALLDRLLAKAPDHRPGSARAVVEALDAVALDLASSPPKPPAETDTWEDLGPVAPPPGRGRAPWLLAALLLLAVVAALVLGGRAVRMGRGGGGPATVTAPSTVLAPVARRDAATGLPPAATVGRRPGGDDDGLPGLVPAPARLPGVARWQLETRTPRGTVHAVAWSPEGDRFACAGEDGAVRVYPADSSAPVRILAGHRGTVRALAWSRDGRRLISGGDDDRVRVWDARSGRPLRVVPASGKNSGVRGVAVSADGHRIAAALNSPRVILLDAETGAPGRVLEGPGTGLSSVAFSPDGRRVAAGGYDHRVWVWDADDGQVIRSVEAPGSGDSLAVAYSPDGRRLAAGFMDGSVRVWEGDEVRPGPVLKGHQSAAMAVAFSPDGRRLASGSDDRTVRVWKVEGGSPGVASEPVESGVNSVAFAPDGRKVLAGVFSGALALFDASDASTLSVRRGRVKSSLSVAFAPDGRRLVSGHFDESVRLWRSDEGTVERSMTDPGTWVVNAVAFHPDGRRVASSSDDGAVRVWDVDDGALLQKLQGSPSPINAVAFSPDGRVASGGRDGAVRLWDVERGEGKILGNHDNWANAVAFAPPGRFLPDGLAVVSGGGDQAVRVWDAAGDAAVVVLKGHARTVVGVAVSPDGRRIASASWDDTARIWLAPGGAPGPVLAHPGRVLAVAFAPDGRLAAGAGDSTVRFWDPETGRAGQVLRTGSAPAVSLSFAPDGRLASAGRDGTVRLWDASGAPLWVALPYSANRSASVSPEGLLKATDEGVEDDLTYRLSGNRILP